VKTISIEAKADNRGLNGLERAMRTSGNDHADPVITFDDAAFALKLSSGVLSVQKATLAD
jgi:hypothetical protein